MRVRLLCGAWAILVVGFYYRRVPFLLPALLDRERLHDAWRSALPAIATVVLVAILLLFARRLVHLVVHGAASPRRVAWPLLAAALGVLGFAAWMPKGAASLLPAAAEAAGRASTALLAAALITFDAWVLGRLVLRLLGHRFSAATERAMFALALGFAVISYLSLALAALGLYRPGLVTGMLVVIAAAGVIALAAKGARVRRTPGANASTPLESFRSVGTRAASDKAWLALSIAAVGLALVAALAPETEYDALWYHLWLPRVWLQHGVATDVPSEYIALYPLTWELVFGAGLATGGQVAAKLLSFLCLPLCGLAAWQLARRFLPSSSPWLAMAILLTVPTVLWEATTAYIDLALAFYVTLGVYALFAWLEEMSPGVKVQPRSPTWLILAVLCLGTATAIKHLGLIVLCLAACLSAVYLLRRRMGAQTLVPAVALVTAALLLAAPWYYRAWRATGDPFFPEMYKVFGAPPSRWDNAAEIGLDRFKAHFGTPRTCANLAMLPWNMTMHEARFGGSLGPVFLAALPAVVAWKRRSARERRVTAWLAFICAAYVAIWASPIGSFQLRFLVPIVPLFALLSSAALGAGVRSIKGRNTRTSAALLLALVLALNLPPFTPLHEADRAGWTGWLTHVVRRVPLDVAAGHVSETQYLREHVATYGAWRFADEHLPATAKVLEFGGGDNFYATRERLSMDSRAVRGAWASGAGGAPEVRRTLDDLAVSHVLFDRKQLEALEHDEATIASQQFTGSALEVQYEDAGAVLYAVRK